MRKAVAVLLMIVFCFACAVSPAEEFGELTFQGIPWFSSPEEAVLHLFETGFMNSELTGNKITELYQIQPVLSGSFIGADPADEADTQTDAPADEAVEEHAFAGAERRAL